MERIPTEILPCGGRAIPDYENWGTICDQCFCVVGSVGMPRQCYDELMKDKKDVETNNK